MFFSSCSKKESTAAPKQAAEAPAAAQPSGGSHAFVHLKDGSKLPGTIVASLKLTRALSWNVTLNDRYLSNPPPGKRKNDTVLTTGIGISFEQR